MDWNYPGDSCSSASPMPGINFRKMVGALVTSGHRVMVSVPAIELRARLYDIGNMAQQVEYLVVKTHVVRSYGLVSCSGAQAFVAKVFNNIRALLNRTYWPKIAYSVSVAPETFTAEVAQLGAPSSGPSRWDNYTMQPGRAHYAALCRQPVIRTPEHPECLMTQRRLGLYNVHVATFSDPAALRSRVRKAYTDGMGMAPVMVYDIDLDDFQGRCGFGMSPLIRALATAAYS